MPSSQLWKVQIWQPWIIISFWLAQMSIVIIPIFELLFVLVLWSALPETRRWLSRYSYFELVSYLVSFILLIVEHSLYARGKLRPLIYLASQTLKSVGPTFEIFRRIQFIRKYARFMGLRAAIVREIVYFLTFWGALAYAISAFVASLRRRRRYRNMSVAEQMHDLFPTTRGINTATKLRATSSNLFKLVSWLNADDSWSSTFPPPFRTSLRWTIFFAKYIFSAPLVVILFTVTRGLSGEPCDSTTAEYLASWKYPTPSNLSPYSDTDAESSMRNGAPLDEESGTAAVGLNRLRHPEQLHHAQESIGRLLLPRFLCFISDAEDGSTELSYTTREVDNGHNRAADLAYVFISYTRRQFYSQIPNDPSLSEAERMRFKTAADRDKRTLIRLAIAAAKEAGVSAFWIDFECIRPEEESAQGADIEEVYRICDIVRASHSMAILLGPALDEDKAHVDGTSKNDWLLGWGERLWTVPEALLCPSEHRIAIYSVDSDVPEKVAKRNLPGRVWDDARMLRELIDHYESSLHLTQLELISIALECLHRRQTETRNAGDVAYALMGLLRLRPSVHKTDTGFQAFARLSLANDSDMILERLLCLSKSSKASPWHDMADTWDVKLWQIKPQFQIAGLGSNNSVMIGSAAGASIDWTSLYPVDFTRTGGQQRRRWRWARHITTYLLACLGWYYVMQFIFVPVVADLGYDYQRLGQERVDYMVKIYGYCFLFLCSLTLSIPAILCQHYRSNLDTIQPRFFGIEGRPNLGQVEKYLFGVNCGRLNWSTEETRVQGYADSRRMFTLIDTRSNTATTFRADEPPSLAFVGASEQGIIRVLLCSYDLMHRMFVKETVVRLESAALQSMQVLERFRFSIDPTAETPGWNSARGSLDSDRISLPDVPEFICLDG